MDESTANGLLEIVIGLAVAVFGLLHAANLFGVTTDYAQQFVNNRLHRWLYGPKIFGREPEDLIKPVMTTTRLMGCAFMLVGLVLIVVGMRDLSGGHA